MFATRRPTNLELDGFAMQTEQTGTPEAGKDFTATMKKVAGDFSADHFIDQVPAEALGDPLIYCVPVLQRALSKTDNYDMPQLLHYLHEGSAVLLIEFAEGRPQGCCVVCVEELVSGRAAHIMAIAAFPGKTFSYPNEKSFGLLADHVRAWGCTCIQGWAIESVARLWQRIEFKEVARLMRKEI